MWKRWTDYCTERSPARQSRRRVTSGVWSPEVFQLYCGPPFRRRRRLSFGRCRFLQSFGDVADGTVNGEETWIVRLRDVELERFVKRDDVVEKIHRVDVELIAKILVRCQSRLLELGRDACQRIQDDFPNFGIPHHTGGSWSRRPTAARKR